MTTKQFYLLCLIGITFIGGTIMLLLWRQIKLKSSENRGMLFISLAMFSWTLVGIYKLSDPPMPPLINAINDRILSAFSNLFLLASLPYFPNVFEGLKERFTVFRKPDQWLNAVFIFFAIVTVVFTLIDRNVTSDGGKKVIIAIDSVISTTTISLISMALHRSLSRFWKDNLLSNFLGLIFVLLISTQIVLPLIAIFPDALKPYYMFVLVMLLLTMVFFNFASVAYFGMVNMEMIEIANLESEKEKTVHYFPASITVGFDNATRKYFIRINFHAIEAPNDEKICQVTSAKLLQPFANWVLFCLAKKQEVKLAHSDLSTTKFRMVEFWNKEAEVKLTQDIIFNNDRGLFDLKIEAENITIENIPFIRSKFIVREVIIKHEDCFNGLDDLNTNEKPSSKLAKQERLVDAVFASK
jgi:hypothetical protein